MLIKFNPFFVFCKCGTLLRRWPPTVPESAPRTDRSSHSRTVHPKTGEHHREQSRQPSRECAGPAIAGTPAQGQRAGRSAAPDSKSMSGSVPLRRVASLFLLIRSYSVIFPSFSKQICNSDDYSKHDNSVENVLHNL